MASAQVLLDHQEPFTVWGNVEVTPLGSRSMKSPPPREGSIIQPHEHGRTGIARRVPSLPLPSTISPSTWGGHHMETIQMLGSLGEFVGAIAVGLSRHPGQAQQGGDGGEYRVDD